MEKEKLIESLKAENSDMRFRVDQIKCELQNTKASYEKSLKEFDKLSEEYRKTVDELQSANIKIKVLEGQIEAYKYCASHGKS